MTGKQRFDEFIIKYLDNAHRLAQIYIKNPDDVEDVGLTKGRPDIMSLPRKTGAEQRLRRDSGKQPFYFRCVSLFFIKVLITG